MRLISEPRPAPSSRRCGSESQILTNPKRGTITTLQHTQKVPHMNRVCERYQENTVQLLNRNNKQTIGVVNKQKTNSWVLNKQLAWSSHRGLQKPFLMSVWTKFGYLSAPVMTIIHKKTKKLRQNAKNDVLRFRNSADNA